MRRLGMVAAPFFFGDHVLSFSPKNVLAPETVKPSGGVFLQEGKSGVFLQEGKTFEFLSTFAVLTEKYDNHASHPTAESLADMKAAFEEYNATQTIEMYEGIHVKFHEGHHTFEIAANPAHTMEEGREFMEAFKAAADALKKLKEKNKRPAGLLLVELHGMFKQKGDIFEPPTLPEVQALITKHHFPIELTTSDASSFRQVAKQRTQFYFGRYLYYVLSLSCNLFVDEAGGGPGEFDWAELIANPALIAQNRFVVDQALLPDQPSRMQMPFRTTCLKFPTTIAALTVSPFTINACSSETTVNATKFVTSSTFSGCWLFIFKDPNSENVEVTHCSRVGGVNLGYAEAEALRDLHHHDTWTLTHVLVNESPTSATELQEARYANLAQCTSPAGLTVFYGTRPDHNTAFDYHFSTSPASDGAGMFRHATVAACAA